jgi:gas vesicle protein
MSKKGLGKFILGAGIGASLGLLFAPKSGKKIRAELKLKLDELLLKAKDVDLNEVRDEFELKVEALKKELDNLDQEKVLKLAKKHGKELEKKALELVDYAKAKGQPVLEQTAETVREKTIELVKEVLKKLEDKGE